MTELHNSGREHTLQSLHGTLKDEGLNIQRIDDIPSSTTKNDVINIAHSKQLKNTKARTSHYKKCVEYIEPIAGVQQQRKSNNI